MFHGNWIKTKFKVKDTEDETLIKELDYCEYHFSSWAGRKGKHNLYIEVPRPFYWALKERIEPFFMEIE